MRSEITANVWTRDLFQSLQLNTKMEDLVAKFEPLAERDDLQANSAKIMLPVSLSVNSFQPLNRTKLYMR